MGNGVLVILSRHIRSITHFRVLFSGATGLAQLAQCCANFVSNRQPDALVTLTKPMSALRNSVPQQVHVDSYQFRFWNPWGSGIRDFAPWEDWIVQGAGPDLLSCCHSLLTPCAWRRHKVAVVPILSPDFPMPRLLHDCGESRVGMTLNLYLFLFLFVRTAWVLHGSGSVSSRPGRG